MNRRKLDTNPPFKLGNRTLFTFRLIHSGILRISVFCLEEYFLDSNDF